MISIVVPAYIIDEACETMTMLCLESICKHTNIEHEVIVMRSYPHARLSYAQAVNQGMSKAIGDFIVVLNNDTEVCKGWIEAMLKCFVNHDCGIGTLLGIEHSSMKANAIVEGFYGPCWMISRKAFTDIGLMSEEFNNSFEDSDYWVRTYLAGYKIYRNLSCVINHKERATCKKIKSDSEDAIRNKELFIEKYGELDLPIYRKLRG